MNRLQHLICIVIIVVFSIFLYANTLKNGFAYDDEFTIAYNVLIKDIRNLPVLFQIEYLKLSGEISYRPIVTLTYFLDYAVFGLEPWGFHLSNVLLHAINGVLLYILLASLNLPPLLGSLLFICHPVLTEPVNAISFREDLLVFFFYILSLNIYLLMRRSPSHLFYAVSCLSYFFALLSKEMAATLPLIIYCYERGYCDAEKERLRSFLSKRLWGYIVISLIYAYLRFFHFYNPEAGNYPRWEVEERFLTVPWIFLSYLKLILFPISLSAVYEVVPIKSPTFQFLISSLIITLFLYTVFAMRKREQGVVFGILFYFITLAPVYNLFPIIHPLADRYLYLPLAGIIIFTVSAIHHLSGRLEYRAAFLTFLIAIFFIFSLLVIERNEVWKNDFSLWSDSIKKMPDSNLAHTNLGNVLADQGRFDDALKELKAALVLKSRYPIAQTHNELGYVYYRTGQIEAAEQAFYTALDLNPNYSTAYNNLGMIHMEQGRFDKAIQDFKSALRSGPFNPLFHFNLGTVYAKKGEIDSAIQQYQAFLRFKPDDFYGHYNLGIVYMRKGMEMEAVKEFEIALKLYPNFLPARQGLEALGK